MSANMTLTGVSTHRCPARPSAGSCPAPTCTLCFGCACRACTHLRLTVCMSAGQQAATRAQRACRAGAQQAGSQAGCRSGRRAALQRLHSALLHHPREGRVHCAAVGLWRRRFADACAPCGHRRRPREARLGEQLRHCADLQLCHAQGPAACLRPLPGARPPRAACVPLTPRICCAAAGSAHWCELRPHVHDA